MKTRFHLCSILPRLAVLLLCLVLATEMWGGDYTLSFTKDASATNYTTARDVTSNGVTWIVYGNQSIGNYLRVGGKNTTATDRTLTSGQIGIAVSSVTIKHAGTGNGSSSAITINSIKLEVSTNSSFSSADEIIKQSPSVSEAGSLEFTPTSGSSWAKNSYYRITVNYQITGSNNCYLIVSSAVFTEAVASPVDPTITFNNGTYTIGGSALDLSTLFTSNSTGTVTYTVKDASVTGATIAADGKSFSATTAGTATVQASQAAVAGSYNAKTVTATITVTAAAAAPYTVSWYVNGTKLTSGSQTTEVPNGGKVTTLPTEPSAACSGKVFVGWTTAPISGSQDTAPSPLFKTAAEAPLVTGDVNYYAVFATPNE